MAQTGLFNRLKRMPAQQVIGIAAGIGLAIFVVWNVLLGGAALFASLIGLQVDYPGLLEGCSSAAAFALTVGGGIVVLVQVNEAVDSRNLEVFSAVFQRMMSDEEIKARRWIYQNLPEDPKEGLRMLREEDLANEARRENGEEVNEKETGRYKVKLILNSFDYLGFLVEQNWVTEEAMESVIGWVSPMVSKVWKRLGPYIEYEASPERRDDPDFYRSARYLASLCDEWQREHTTIGEYRFLEDAL
ncbi:MAG: hypothetical protein GYB64_03345 [Chloroflexi bacterium]|nr:hypothetical protein [Chloroflexota bacterium]